MKDALLSVIVPVYNESNTLRNIIERVSRAPHVGQIVLVNDGSQDGTAEIAEELAREHGSIHLISYSTNRGKGWAIQQGIRAATCPYVLIQDADLEYDPEDYAVLMEPLLNSNFKVVYGSRFLAGTKVTTAFHFAVNKLITLYGNLLYGAHLTDLETCYKVFESDVLRSLDLTSPGFEIEAEITAKTLKKKIPIHEVPVSYKGRNYEQGKKITWWDGVVTLWLLLKLRFSRS